MESRLAEKSDFGDSERLIVFDRGKKVSSTPIGDELLTLGDLHDMHMDSEDRKKNWVSLNKSIFETPVSSGRDRTGTKSIKEDFGNIEPPMVHHSLVSKQGSLPVGLEPVLEEKNTLEKGTDFGYDSTPQEENELSEIKDSPSLSMQKSLFVVSFFGSKCDSKFLKAKKSQLENLRKAAKQPPKTKTTSPRLLRGNLKLRSLRKVWLGLVGPQVGCIQRNLGVRQATGSCTKAASVNLLW